jgi:hypothetical protein
LLYGGKNSGQAGMTEIALFTGDFILSFLIHKYWGLSPPAGGHKARHYFQIIKPGNQLRLFIRAVHWI